MFSRCTIRRLCGLKSLSNGKLKNDLPIQLARTFATEATETPQIEVTRKLVPRRALLYVPGDDQRKIDKTKSVQADCVVLDCEDGVAANKKEEARNMIQKNIQTLDLGRTEIAVRINSMESGLAKDDLKVLFSGEKVPKTLLLPKVDKKEHLDQFAEQLVKALGKKKINDINLITYVESAKGLLDLRDICNHAIELSEFSLFWLDGIVFGSDDFCANIGATRSQQANEVSFARQQVIVTAKAFDLQAFDVVYIDYKDLEGLKKQCIEGAQLGFTGKQAIHPDQIPIIQDAFKPSKDKVEWAKELIKQWNQHQKEGKGAFVFKGQMIDKPLLLQAQNIIEIDKMVN